MKIDFEEKAPKFAVSDTIIGLKHGYHEQAPKVANQQ